MQGLPQGGQGAPGAGPAALFHLIGNTVFLRLSDVASGLPSYEEQVQLSSMDDEEDTRSGWGTGGTGYSQKSVYGHMFSTLREALALAPSGCWSPTRKPS